MLDFMHRDFDDIFGVLYKEKEVPLSQEQEAWLKDRELARGSKDWARSDDLRKKLLASGVEVQDTPQGQKWRYFK